MIFRVLLDLTNGRPLFDKLEHVCRQHLLVGKRRIGVVALPQGHCGELGSEALAEKQVDPNGRGGSISPGSTYQKDVGCTFFKEPAATCFTDP